MKNYRRGFKLLDCISRITIYNISTYFCITTSTDRPQHDKYNSHSNNPTNWGTGSGSSYYGGTFKSEQVYITRQNHICTK